MRTNCCASVDGGLLVRTPANCIVRWQWRSLFWLRWSTRTRHQFAFHITFTQIVSPWIMLTSSLVSLLYHDFTGLWWSYFWWEKCNNRTSEEEEWVVFQLDDPRNCPMQYTTSLSFILNCNFCPAYQSCSVLGYGAVMFWSVNIWWSPVEFILVICLDVMLHEQAHLNNPISSKALNPPWLAGRAGCVCA